MLKLKQFVVYPSVLWNILRVHWTGKVELAIMFCATQTFVIFVTRNSNNKIHNICSYVLLWHFAWSWHVNFMFSAHFVYLYVSGCSNTNGNLFNVAKWEIRILNMLGFRRLTVISLTRLRILLFGKINAQIFSDCYGIEIEFTYCFWSGRREVRTGRVDLFSFYISKWSYSLHCISSTYLANTELYIALSKRPANGLHNLTEYCCLIDYYQDTLISL